MRTLGVISLLFVLLLPATAFADDSDAMEQMKEELVQVKDGKFVYSKIQRCEPKGESGVMQIEWNAEAPAEGLMSRDYFLSTVTKFSVVSLFSILDKAADNGYSPSDAMDKLNCKMVDDAIGKVDLSVSFVFSKGGLQLQFESADGKKKQKTMTWEQVHGGD
jgi:hypothetical protein